jgi:cell division protein FtsW (lipid II flippase)
MNTYNSEHTEEFEIETGSSNIGEPSVTDQTSGKSTDQNYNNRYGEQDMGRLLKIPFLLGAVWAIVAVSEGVQLIRQGFLFIDRNSSWLGHDYYVDLAVKYLAEGALLLISGIFIILSCMHMYKIEKYRKASTYYLIGSVLAVLSGLFLIFVVLRLPSEGAPNWVYVAYGYSLIAGIAGIIFFFIIVKEKNRFRS